jgi:hypothetical protein
MQILKICIAFLCFCLNLNIVFSSTLSTCDLAGIVSLFRCNFCDQDASGKYYCQTCWTGYFALMGICVPCPINCQLCQINPSENSTFWTTVKTFWNTKFQDALTTQTPPNPLPAFMNSFNFANMTNNQMQGWSEAYYLFQSLSSQINSVFTTAQLRPILF